MGTSHILAIDDDPAMRELVAGYLAKNDLQVTAVATGAEMAQALAERVIDLVVLDLRLAGEDGMQLARRLREQSTVPIIIVTGKNDEADRVMGLELGADDYVTKPFSPREFNLLHAFCAAPQRVLSRDQLLDLSRLNGAEVYDRSVDVQILRLRRKIEPDPGQPQYIRTERGMGYVFSVAVQSIH